MSRPAVLALDLEGTLISNAFSQIPRPGLHGFLAECAMMTRRIVIFTTVAEPTFRAIARQLVASGDAPDWFERLEYVTWHGPKKDLAAVAGTTPADVIIVDDDPARFALPEQLANWRRIEHFDSPYRNDDDGFASILPALRAAIDSTRQDRSTGSDLGG